MTLDVMLVHKLLVAVRKRRIGDLVPLPPVSAQLLDDEQRRRGEVTLSALCAALSSQLDGHVTEPRAADACARFYGLGRLPESLDVIAATLPSKADNATALRVRRVKQLIDSAEEQLAAGLVDDRIIAISITAHPAAETAFTDGSLTDRERLSVLMRAWADVPGGDARSAAALMLFEQETGLRPPLPGGLHREARRRSRRRARAIVGVALERRSLSRRPASEAPGRGWRTDPAVDRLLGPREHVVESCPTAVDQLLRQGAADRGLDPDGLVVACDHVRALVTEGHGAAACLLGILRTALARSARRVPALVVVRTLAMTTIVARENDDPAGLVAAEEACRVARSAMAESPRARDIRGIVSSTIRAIQELAELHARLGQVVAARAALRQARTLLDEHGDPEADEEPDGWLQQIAYTASLIERRAAMGDRDRLGRLASAHGSAVVAVELVDRHAELPDDRGLTAGAVLGQVAVDRALAEVPARARPARQLVQWAGRLVEANEHAWQAHGEPTSSTARSARLLAVVSACRLALADHDPDAYLWQRGRLARRIGPRLLRADIDEVRLLERQAEAAGVAPAGLVARLRSGPERIGQRSWAPGGDRTG